MLFSRVFLLVLTLSLASSVGAQTTNPWNTPQVWDEQPSSVSTPFEVLTYSGSICHLLAFEGATHAAQIYPENGYLVPGTPIRFNPNWCTFTSGPYSNNPSGTAILFATSGPASEVTFDICVSRISVYYALTGPGMAEVLDEEGFVLATTGLPVTGTTQFTQVSFDLGSNQIRKLRFTRPAGVLLIDDLEVCYEADPDSDNDGLTDAEEAALGTDPNNPDSDHDGLWDGTEVDMQTNEHPGCPNPLDPDSDGDLLLDGAEANASPSTNPCLPDTDDDGICDLIDSEPITPGTSTSVLEDAIRIFAEQIDALSSSYFDAPNENAAKGRRNSISSRLNNAANSISRGQVESARALLEGVLQKLDGQGNDDWLFPSVEQAVFANCIAELVILLS